MDGEAGSEVLVLGGYAHSSSRKEYHNSGHHDASVGPHHHLPLDLV